MLLMGDFASYLELYRACWIGGRYGGGKTALAYALARYFKRRGYTLISNIPTFEGQRYWKDKQEPSQSVILLDEAAEYLDPYNPSGMRLLTAFRYARHQDNIFIFPSIDTVQKRLRKLIVYAFTELSPLALGITRVFLYRWWVGPDEQPPEPSRKRFKFSSGGWILFAPGVNDWKYTSTHGGRGLTTGIILRQLLADVKSRVEIDTVEV